MVGVAKQAPTARDRRTVPHTLPAMSMSTKQPAAGRTHGNKEPNSHQNKLVQQGQAGQVFTPPSFVKALPLHALQSHRQHTAPRSCARSMCRHRHNWACAC